MENKITIAIGADHAGFCQKEEVVKLLKDAGYEVKDLGTYSTESVDYPDFVHPVAQAVEKGDYQYGVLLCGSANGVAMTANKYQGIRAALCWMPQVAELARQHNNANIICLPSRFLSDEEAKKIVTAFLSTSFEGGRHERRVEKIAVKAG